MTNAELLKLSQASDRLLSAEQKARFRDLAGIEKLLFKRLVAEVQRSLQEDGGRITSRKGFVSTGKAIDTIFDKIEQVGLAKVARATAKGTGQLLSMNARYYQSIAEPKRGEYAAIKKAVIKRLQQRLGLDAKGKVRPKGYLSQVQRTEIARDEIKKLVAKAVAAGIPMKKLERQLRVQIQGTARTAGILERNIGGFVLDAYQVADSITNNEFAARLDLKYFIYSGGLIETSRGFCRKRNNKVFTTEEAKTWERDPLLPRTKAEADSGVITDYNPLEDRGRWFCRHRLLYIPYEEAVRRRPDLPKP
jgi:hypothetical protein